MTANLGAALHIHLDPVGGIAGDMFVAALLDAFPEHAAAACTAAASISGAACSLQPHHDGVMTGARFHVADHEPAAGHHHHDSHHHTDWRDIRRRIAAAALDPEVRRHATGIFAVLAEAEGRVHGCAAEEVTFHEVGATDSIADIVAAAFLIAAVGSAGAPASWSVGKLPLGGGTVATAHGVMPVPTPATALLLQDFICIDDGIAGERVTPTGAAILRYLGASSRSSGGRLARTGTGFGTRKLPSRSNVLRTLVFIPLISLNSAEETPESEAIHRELAVISFEVDDQSAEDLAAGLDRLRAHAAVHDVLQLAAFGKKGRIATQVQVLARPDAIEEVVNACFFETTTIGLRTQVVQARALVREQHEVRLDDAVVRVKRTVRPGGITGKAEADDVRAIPGHAARSAQRRRAEALAEAATSRAAASKEEKSRG